MATAAIATNVLNLNLTPKGGNLTISMSLQRHHYRFCAAAGAIVKNSLMYSSVTNADAITDAVEIGAKMEALLNKFHRPAELFGKVLMATTSSRQFLVDNSALDPDA